MPIENFGIHHATPAQKSEVIAPLHEVIGIMTELSQNFTDDDRKKFGTINEQRKLFTNKVNEYNSNQPGLSSPDVDWTEFTADYGDRSFAQTVVTMAKQLLRLAEDYKLAHDYDNYHGALTDYKYTAYKAESTTPGYTEKLAELQQFFEQAAPEPA